MKDMLIKTTIYMHNEILRKINEIVQNNKKARGNLITLLLKRAMQDNKRLMKRHGSIKYQESDKPKQWKTIHVKFNEDDYEYFIDMRKLYKMSVSLILAYAVRNYFFEMANKLKRKLLSGNYFPNGYFFNRELVDGIVCWRLYWGFPNNPKEIFYE
jgi:hypothetical protein